MTEPTIYAVGETVFDIIFEKYQPRAAKPGGSAFNALISLGRLGVPCSFISEVGNDKIGHYIKEFLEQNGVDSEYVVMFEEGKTALSLAFLNEQSDAEYDFYKDYPNQRLNKEIPDFKGNDYLLFGSFYGLNPVLRPQIKRLLDAANQNGALVYYDPNFRSSHMDDLEQLKGIIEENFMLSTIVRGSDEDMRNIYGVETGDQAWDIVREFTQYFVYTANAKGVDLYTPEFKMHLDVERIKPVSTIGAGDTFNAGIMHGFFKNRIDRSGINKVGKELWKQILQTAAEYSREVCLSYDNYITKK